MNHCSKRPGSADPEKGVGDLSARVPDPFFRFQHRLDLVVDDTVLTEIKAVEELHPIHEAQLPTYLRHSGLSIGLLIYFNVRFLKDGIKRMVL